MPVLIEQPPIPAGLEYLGTWDANTNNPALATGGIGGTQNQFYVCSVADASFPAIDGITSAIVGDWMLNDGHVWSKVPYTAPASPDPLANTYRVSSTGGSFTTIQAAITAINALAHTNGVRLVIDGGIYTIDDTIIINSTCNIMIEGSGKYSTIIKAATGLENKPMFDIRTKVSFYRLGFDGTLAGWTATTSKFLYYNTTAITSVLNNLRFDGSEIAISVTKGVRLNITDVIIDNATTGMAVNTTESPIIHFNSAGEFNSCGKAIHLIQSVLGRFIFNGIIFNNAALGVAITYVGANVTFEKFSIINCIYNYVGTFLSGFDWTIARDANIYVKSNVGEEDKKAHAKINVAGASATQNLTSNTPAKLTLTNTDSYACKFTVANNKLTYLPDGHADIGMWVSIACQTNTRNSEFKFGIVKNNVTTTFYGKQNIFFDTNDRTSNLALNVYLDDVAKNDYFEIFCTAVGANETIRMIDVNWLAVEI
jgi:hypothetical protein